MNLRLQNKLAEIKENEVRYETMMIDDAEFLIVAFGTVGRIAQSAVRQARAAGVKAGLFRPVTLWPFPEKELEAAMSTVRGVLVVEMNAGQMVEDVRAIAKGRIPVQFSGRMGGTIPLPDDILPALDTLIASVRSRNGNKPEPTVVRAINA